MDCCRRRRPAGRAQPGQRRKAGRGAALWRSRNPPRHCRRRNSLAGLAGTDRQDQRAQLLRAWFELILDNAEDLARLITAECGKPLAEARGEVAYGASFVEWFAEEGKRTYGESIPSTAANTRLLSSSSRSASARRSRRGISRSP
jgi:hypothetical protein